MRHVWVSVMRVMLCAAVLRMSVCEEGLSLRPWSECESNGLHCDLYCLIDTDPNTNVTSYCACAEDELELEHGLVCPDEIPVQSAPRCRLSLLSPCFIAAILDVDPDLSVDDLRTIDLRIADDNSTMFNDHGFLDISILLANFYSEFCSTYDTRLNKARLVKCLNRTVSVCVDLLPEELWPRYDPFIVANAQWSLANLAVNINGLCKRGCDNYSSRRAEMYGDRCTTYGVQLLYTEDLCEVNMNYARCLWRATGYCLALQEEAAALVRHLPMKQYHVNLRGIWQACGIVDEYSKLKPDSVVDDYNECESNPCPEFSWCTDLIGGYRCQCFTWYIEQLDYQSYWYQCRVQTVDDAVDKAFSTEGKTLRANVTHVTDFIRFRSQQGSEYKDSSVYIWNVTTRQTGGYLKIDMLSIDIEDDAACRYDALKIYDGDTKKLLISYCGRPRTEPLYLASRSAILLLRTDHSVTQTGFYVELEWTDAVQHNKDAFKCVSQDNVYVHPDSLCDRKKDCLDGSDENRTAHNCEELRVCGTGQSYSAYVWCDGITDCMDGTDEMDCEDWFLCDQLSDPISTVLLCNGHVDCENNDNDETRKGGCPVPSCADGLCQNGAQCYNTTNRVGYRCYCDRQWRGEHCEIDNEDNCINDKTCAGGSTCLDKEEGVMCLCPQGVLGDTCERDVGRYDGVVMYVDKSTGVDGDCGSEETPCGSLIHAIARAPEEAKIYVKGTSKNTDGNSQQQTNGVDMNADTVDWSQDNTYTIDQTWMTQSVILIADSDTNMPVVKLNGTIFTSSTDSHYTNIIIQNIAVTGTAFFGSVSLSFDSCFLKDFRLQQEMQQRAAITEGAVNFRRSLIHDSVIETVLPTKVFNLYTFEILRMVILQCRVVNSFFNMTSLASYVSVEHSSFVQNNSRQLQHISRSGLHINSGIDYSAIQRLAKRANAAKSSVFLNNVTFTGMYEVMSDDHSALKILTHQALTIWIRNSAFKDNRRAISVDIFGSGHTGMRIFNSVFEGNVAEGPGGALLIDQKSGQISTNISECYFAHNQALDIRLDNKTTPKDFSKVTGSGGAIAVNMALNGPSSNIVIYKSQFVNNTASTYGGTCSIGQSITASFEDCIFQNLLQKNKHEIRPSVGDILESRGSLKMLNCTFIVTSAVIDVPVIAYRASSKGSFLESAGTTFACPSGHTVENVTSLVPVTNSRKSIETFLLYCIPCLNNYFSFEHSEILINGTNLQRVVTATCNPCPYGANCDDGVQAKANFWGEKLNSSIQMYNCPEEYCCQHPKCRVYDECAPHRHGTLCGECIPGYSEALFSTECVQDEDCSYTSTFWIIVALYGFVYVVFFVLEEEWQLIVEGFGLWLKAAWQHIRASVAKTCRNLISRKSQVECNSVNETQSSERENSKTLGDSTPDTENSEDDEDLGAYLSIFMYYIQIPSILKVNIIYQTERGPPFGDLFDALRNIFNFNTYGLDMKTCLFKGVTAVFKIWIKFGYVAYLLLVLIFLYLTSKLFSHCVTCKRWPLFRESASINAKFVAAFVSLLLYTYQYFAENGFAMLKCVTLESSNELVLHIDGHVKCYTSWQFIFIIFVCVYVIPFAFVLSIAPNLLKRQLLGIKIFILSLILPLFSLPVLLKRFISAVLKDNRDKTASRGHYHTQQAPQGEHVKAHNKDASYLVSHVLTDPYNNDFAWGICWEGVVALRRLVLIVIATFIPSLLLKHLLLMVGCFIPLIMQVLIKPFSKKSCNVMEMISLSILLMVSAVNLLKSAYFQSGEIPDKRADEVFQYYDWLEAILLAFIPTCIAGLVALAIVLRLLSWPYELCKERRRQTRVYVS